MWDVGSYLSLSVWRARFLLVKWIPRAVGSLTDNVRCLPLALSASTVFSTHLTYLQDSFGPCTVLLVANFVGINAVFV